MYCRSAFSTHGHVAAYEEARGNHGVRIMAAGRRGVHADTPTSCQQGGASKQHLVTAGEMLACRSRKGLKSRSSSMRWDKVPMTVNDNTWSTCTR